MNKKTEGIINEAKKVIIGKDDVIKKVMMAILSGGHVLLDDVPGTGKTTLALAFARAMDMRFRRIQFTPDVVPSDIVGFSIYNKEKREFEYKAGAVMTNILLADEINRTSSKTQAALLEVMEEGQATVDGEKHVLPEPFVVIATQNPVGSAGTQLLPQAQLDRFIVRLRMGYPGMDEQVEILKDRQRENPLDRIAPAAGAADVMAMREEVRDIHVEDSIFIYISALAEATRSHDMVKLGVSPRGSLAVAKMAKANAFIEGRDFVMPEDIRGVFEDVCAHRIIPSPKAKMADMTAEGILSDVIKETKSPDSGR